MKCIKTGFVLGLLLNSLLSTAQNGTLVDTRDGKEYKTVQIGTQTWMAENLAYGPSITYLFHWDPNAVKMGIYCYDDDTTLIADYGLLYSWDAAMKSCPIGWHLPSKAEFDTLLAYAGSDIKTRYEKLGKGGETGFEFSLGGYLFFSSSSFGSYFALDALGRYWSSTGKIGTSHIYLVSFNGHFKECKMGEGSKYFRHKPAYPTCQSVRCIKDMY